MKKKVTHSKGYKFDCPDKGCTVCKAFSATMRIENYTENNPEEFVLDHLQL